MNLLLDTHALIWFLSNDPRLSRKARESVESPAHSKYVSVASGWEMAIKSELGKLILPIRFDDLFPGKLETLGFVLLPVVSQHVRGIIGLPDRHRDPFDRMLVAQARAEGMTVVSGDTHFSGYPVSVLW